MSDFVFSTLKRLVLLVFAAPSVLLLNACATADKKSAVPFTLADAGYFKAQGAEVLAFNNAPGGMFFDAKTSGVEIIHHGERTATNGDVRLLPTPQQWDGMAELVERAVDPLTNTVSSRLVYPEHDFNYQIKVRSTQQGVLVSVHLDEPLPQALLGQAGLNMEFLPAAYWNKSYLMDDQVAQFPRSASNPGGMRSGDGVRSTPVPLASGQRLVLAPADPEHRISIRAGQGTAELQLYDGRSEAQNGWYVVRSLLPADRTGVVAKWQLQINRKPDWLRPAVIGYSQVGYHPRQVKRAVIELDAADEQPIQAKLLRVDDNGDSKVVLVGKTQAWGNYLRYRYEIFDFTAISKPGLYQLQYGDQRTSAFPIHADVHSNNWQPTLDFFFPAQMDHMLVKEAYRTWHGHSHQDDALQAPANYEHFDLFAHGEQTDTEFQAFEHIPGLNYGGWYDAGDYDIRTQSQYQTVQGLVHAYEEFDITRDNTTVRQNTHYVEINRPDGRNDILQQIEHGTLALLAQHRAIGHAIPGIVAGHLYQYPHLGDGVTKTDNKIYRSELDPHAEQREVGAMYRPSTVDPRAAQAPPTEQGQYSGRFDDRWAFTTNTSALNYGSAAALAAAGRALVGYDDGLAAECLKTAQNVWQYESERSPNTFRFGNTTGGPLAVEQLKAAVELLISTQDSKYQVAVAEALAKVENQLDAAVITMLSKALPHMDAAFARQLQNIAKEWLAHVAAIEEQNPYGVPITRGGWAGNGTVMDFGISAYWLHKVFPDLVPATWVARSLNYLYGTHPDSNYSFVSAVGAHSQTFAYGYNRADFSFIPGGVVPGVLILNPDYPENKSDWPFFWGQNEYVIPMGSRYLFLTHAAQQVLQ